ARLVQIAGGEALGEPGVNGGERSAGLVPLAPRREQAREAGGRPQLERFLSPTARQLDRVAEASRGPPRVLEMQLAFQPPDLRSNDRRAILLAHRCERDTPHLRTSGFQAQLGEQAQADDPTPGRAPDLRESPVNVREAGRVETTAEWRLARHDGDVRPVHEAVRGADAR